MSRLAFRMHALGVAEAEAHAYLRHLEAVGVRSVARFTRGMPDAAIVDDAAAALEAERASRRRGDVLRVRTPRRWPWRTSTSQRDGASR